MPYSLSGSGTHAVGAGVGALHIHVDVQNPVAGFGRANPLNYFDFGLIRLGDGIAYWIPIALDAVDQWVGVPTGTTTLGYALINGTQITVTEIIGTNPFGGPIGPQGPAGPPGSGAWTLIGEVSAPMGGASSLGFLALPSTYRHIQAFYKLRSTAALLFDTPLVRFNGDSTASYSWATAESATGSAGNQAGSGATGLHLPYCAAANASAGAVGDGFLIVPYYANSNWWKGAEWINMMAETTTAQWTDAGAGKWQSTVPITSIVFSLVTGNFAQNSIISLYGIS